MSDNQTSPNSRDWLLLIGGSTYKFTLTGFYLVALVAILKNHGYSLNQLSWIHLIGGIEAAKVLFAALMERRPAGRFGRFRGWLLAATLGLSAVFGLMACTDITQNFVLLLTCCVLLSAMSAVYGCAMPGFVVHRPAAPRTRFRRRDSDHGGARRQDDRRRAGVVAVSGIRADGGGRLYAGVQPADAAATLVLP